jgi:hypothetical protein
LAAIPREEILGALPPTLRSIADASSLDAALILAAEYGGRRIHIPCKVTPSCNLAKLVGGAEAARLVAEFAGTYVDMPTANRLRQPMIRHSDAPTPQLAKLLGLTERYVRRVRQKGAHGRTDARKGRGREAS